MASPSHSTPKIPKSRLQKKHGARLRRRFNSRSAYICTYTGLTFVGQGGHEGEGDELKHGVQGKHDSRSDPELPSDGSLHESGDDHRDENEADEEGSQDLERLCSGV